jgi:4-carboxymuconolactone decarboxylase
MTAAVPATETIVTPAQSATVFKQRLNIFLPCAIPLRFILHFAWLTLADAGPTAWTISCARRAGCKFTLARHRGQKEARMPSDPERRARGAQKIGEILGQTPDQVERSLGDVAPQLATYVLETIYGDIYQSPTLDSRTRQIVTVAALATLGTAAPQLRTHIGGALRCGVTREELVEIMMQLVPYVGVAAAINGIAACREVFAAADKK